MKPLDQVGANQFIEGQLDVHLKEIEAQTNADVLAYIGPIYDRVDDFIRMAVEELKARTTPKDTLIFVLETDGGLIEVAQRIAETLRRHYKRVEFVVPNHAMSAGTVLVMSGDAIRMDYYAVLGPIDPQVFVPKRGWVPALGYLVQYERLMKKAATPDGLNTAEMALLIQGFDQAELYRYEQARNLSITLLKEWLVKYKFKDWKKTATRKKTVTKAMRTNRARRIAAILNDTDRWHTHGRGISMEVLRRDLNLVIDDLEQAPDLYKAVKSYHGLLKDYAEKLGMSGTLHIHETFLPIMG